MKMLDLILTSQKYASVTPLDSTGCGRRPETYRRTCVCCFQVMPGGSSYCSYCCHVLCLFPVPFQCLSSAFSSAFCSAFSRFVCACQWKKCCHVTQVLLKQKDKIISFVATKVSHMATHFCWQAHTNREKALAKGTGKGTGKALGTDTAHGNSKNRSWNCSSSGLLSWRLLSSLATCRCESVVEHRKLKHRVLRMKMLDLILTSQKYANVTPLDSRWTKYSNPCANNCRQTPDPQRSMLNITWLNLCFQGLICFVHSPKQFLQDYSNIELWGRRGPRGWKGLNISSSLRYWVWTATGDFHTRVLFSSDAGRFQLPVLTVAMCCVCSQSLSSAFCHVPFALSRGPARKRDRLSFCFNKTYQKHIFAGRATRKCKRHWKRHWKGWKGTGNKHGTWQQ